MIPFNMSTQFTSTIDVAPLGTSPRSNDRGSYLPRVSRVGPPYMKALVFEGHRYASANIEPDYDHALNAAFGGAFGGVGPWINNSKEMDRTMAPGEPLRDQSWAQSLFSDRRPIAFRHGGRSKTGGLSGAVIGNIGYFDGSVRTMTDLEATDPDMWFPTGSRLNGPREFWESTQEAFARKLEGGYRVP